MALDINSDKYDNHKYGEPDTFLQDYDAKNIVKEKSCFKSIENPSCVDLFITKSVNSFQHTKVISSGLSDCHTMVVTVLQTTIQKRKPEIIYRDYSKFNQKTFRENLKESFMAKNTNNDLSAHAPIKKKVVRANHMPYDETT